VKRLELHHIVPIKDVDPDSGFDPNVQSNLVTLCTDCHKSYHACYEESYPSEKFLDWLHFVPMDEVTTRLRDYRKAKRLERYKHALKHQHK